MIEADELSRSASSTGTRLSAIATTELGAAGAGASAIQVIAGHAASNSAARGDGI